MSSFVKGTNGITEEQVLNPVYGFLEDLQGEIAQGVSELPTVFSK